MFALGAMYSGGHNYPVDRAEAQRWFRAAAELGHGQAQLMLARYLASGVAGEPNPEEARLWLQRAIAQGVPHAESTWRISRQLFCRNQQQQSIWTEGDQLSLDEVRIHLVATNGPLSVRPGAPVRAIRR
jgi:TPR repeat protein